MHSGKGSYTHFVRVLKLSERGSLKVIDADLVKEILRQPSIKSTPRVPLTHFSPIYGGHCDQRGREVEPRPFVRKISRDRVGAKESIAA